MSSVNFWGHSIPRPEDVARQKSMRDLLESLLLKVGVLLGFESRYQRQLLDVALLPPFGPSGGTAYENSLKNLFRGRADSQQMQAAIADRSRIVTGEVEPFLVGHSLLDIGCGNGLIAAACAKHFDEVLLLDVVRYLHPGIHLAFSSYSEGSPLPGLKTFDTVLLLTVLHHANDPLFLLRQAWGKTQRRLIIIESVFGAADSHLAESYQLAGRRIEDQLAYAVYVDWLYNRVLHDEIPVPFNFTTPRSWHDVFAREYMPVAISKNLGQDIPIAPELHYLFILEK